jgi:hypothetical protein
MMTVSKLRWVSQIMDELIEKMPENIKNIIVVSKEIRAKVLEGEKRKILRAYIEVRCEV